MTVSNLPGPLSAYGTLPARTASLNQPPNAAPATFPNENPDLAPSIFWGGVALRDPEMMPLLGGGALQAGGYPSQDVGWYLGVGGAIVIDQVPSAISTTNLAALQAPTLNTPLTLAAGTGITTLASALTILPTGLIVPSGTHVIDTPPAWLGSGQSGAFKFFDPAHGIARAVSLTSGANLSGINFTIRGYDIYGRPMTQTLAGPNVNTVTTLKAFKFVTSITPNGTSASTLSAGTSDIYGFPIRVDTFAYAEIFWNNAPISSNTGFVAAVTTSPATALTGDTRGTYATQSASDGTKALQIFIAPRLANVVGSSAAAMTTGLKGVLQA